MSTPNIAYLGYNLGFMEYNLTFSMQQLFFRKPHMILFFKKGKIKNNPF